MMILFLLSLLLSSLYLYCGETVKILTWNSQGDKWNDIASKIISLDIDIALIQESGNPSILNQLQNAMPASGGTSHFGELNIGSDSRPAIYFIHHWTFGVSAYQSHMLCIVKSEYIVTANNNPPPSIAPPTVGTGLRPLVGANLNNFQINGQTINSIYCIHAPSGNGNAAAGVTLLMLNNIAANNLWYVFGDFNNEPTDLENYPNRPAGLVFKVIGAGGKTFNNEKEYDYGVCSNNIGNEQPTTRTIGTLIGNPLDHQSVLMEFA